MGDTQRSQRLDEASLIRRTLVVVTAVALVSVPISTLGLEDRQSWIAAAHIALFLPVLALLTMTRVSLAAATTGAAVVMFTISVFSVADTAARAAAGDAPGLGTGLLWAAAVLMPIAAVSMSVGRAVLLNASGVLVGLLVAVARAGVDVVLTDPGTPVVIGGVVVVLAVSAVVAQRAGVATAERAAATVDVQHRQEAAAAQEAQIAHRRAVFGGAARRLREPLSVLSTELVSVRAVTEAADSSVDAAGRAAFRRAGEALESFAEQIRATLVDVRTDAVAPGPGAARGAQHDTSGAEPSAADPTSPQAPLATAALALAMVMLVFDASAVYVLGGQPLHEPQVYATAANRMLVVLCVVAGVIAITLPVRIGIVAVAATLALHPLLVVSSSAPSPVLEAMVPWLAPAWRVSLIAVSALGLLSVVTERRRTETARARHEAESVDTRLELLQHREGRTAELYAQAAHELQGPLAVIRSSMATLEQNRAELRPGQVADLLDGMDRSVARLGHRLAEMQVAVGDRGARRPRREPTMTAILALRQALDVAYEQIEGHPVREVLLLPDSIRIAASPSALEQVVENLLTNAHKYGDERAIEIDAEVEGDDLVLLVRSLGGDLTPEEARTIFEPYVRAGSARQRAQGTGLGLAVVSRLVAEWSGRVTCEVVGEEVLFRVTIPIVRQ